MGEIEQPHADDDQPERRFNQEQYDMLLRCSEKKDTTEWNEWRNANPDAQILLEGADLEDAYLKRSQLGGAHLERAILMGAHLEGADLLSVRLQGAQLFGAHLESAELMAAHLQNADLRDAHLEGASLMGTYLGHADFTMAIVDGATQLWHCLCDADTDFSGVGLANARISPGLRSALEANVRRFFWRDWYRTSRYENGMARFLARILKQPVRLFWATSDYGQSTPRIIATFFGGALLFALIYFFFPGFVAHLHLPNAGTGETFLRSCYFSVVTMTTLGFGDMHAEQGSIVGYFLLMFQVILGYVILGALVTRLAVLFRET